MESRISCCGSIHPRGQYRKHMDHCRRLPDNLKIDCTKCGRSVAKEMELCVGDKDYIVPPHKCTYIQNRKTLGNRIRKASSKRRQMKRWAFPQRRTESKQLTIRNLIGPDFHEFSMLSLFQTAEVLHFANQIRNSKMFKNAFDFNLRLGRVSNLMMMEYDIAEFSLLSNGHPSSHAMVKRYFYFCSYYRNFLKTSINHRAVRLPAVKPCGNNREKAKSEYENLPVGLQSIEEIHFAYLLSTGQTNLYNLCLRIKFIMENLN